jgi:DNA-binding MarR family transcriptional regulator
MELLGAKSGRRAADPTTVAVTVPVATALSLPPDRQVAWLLHRLEQARRLREQCASLGAADQRLMWLFQDRRPRTLKEIAEELGLEQSTVNRQVNAALAEGLLRRYRESGQAARLVTATEDGLARFDADLELLLGACTQALGALDEQERAGFLAGLARFVAGYETAVGSGASSSEG